MAFLVGPLNVAKRRKDTDVQEMGAECDPI